MQLDELVRTALTERRDLLEAIVRREVEAVVSELVDAELNGNAMTATTPLDRSAPPSAETKLCRTCNVEKPAAAFERGRNKCRACRRADAGRGKVRPPVERQELAAPFAGSQATPSP
jgi:hypothetical protein